MLDADEPVLLTIKITLDEVVPPVWRRIAVPSDILLPDLHNVIQDAMGWEDRHLHAFYTGERSYGDGQRFEMQISLDEDDDGSGTAEDDVPVGRLLSQAADSLGYQYDFGDDWKHRLVVESVEPLSDNDVRCIDGARACPPEDCGGAHGYEELLEVLADPSHEEYRHYSSWAGDVAPERFEVDEANARIAARRHRVELSERLVRSAPLLAPILERAPLEYHRLLTILLQRIEFDDVDVDPVVASIAMEKLSWMLARIGPDGLPLTAAGYLRPVDVAALRNELNWGKAWIGRSSREIDNPIVFEIRAAIKNLGLARVLKGRLVLTRDGRRLAEDPVGLWRRAAQRLPLTTDRLEFDAGVILLVTVAAGSDHKERNDALFESLSVSGWRVPESERPYLQFVGRPTYDLLTVLGAVEWSRGKTNAGPAWARLFARHSLGVVRS